MARSPSEEPQRGASRRKGTRSVSTLTPSQLARKRANDREAQRAIRARTKEHIERLEIELEDLRNGSTRDRTVQELLRRNKFLEEELLRLRESMGVPSANTSPYASHTQVYEDNISNPRSSPFPSNDYASSIPDYHTHSQQPPPPHHQHHSSYVSMPHASDAWASGLPPTSAPGSAPSVASSPSSSGDDYAAAAPVSSAPSFMPTSVPSPAAMMASRSKSSRMDYHPLDAMDAGYMTTPSSLPPSISHNAPSASFMHPPPHHEQPWTAFPVYYPQQVQSPVH